jgi:hypothetical protein
LTYAYLLNLQPFQRRPKKPFKAISVHIEHDKAKCLQAAYSQVFEEKK